ncbi:hypothetical protein [Bifidobacterium myosotis]|uniref:Uncharacterized protein n=1 Tax=Bifidobacterium myosotis TaxID=1630166 RepID=A0A5M9ZKT3_9BIFI|nr:hypothetical protein [Bifidobacterium myosotis]KAA8828125.1 hypothetical protein EMO91_06705 [Bifidobacterium myosotis]
MDDSRPYWLILGGYGQDGGFGDYAEPVWDEEPLRRPDGGLVWFRDGGAADEFARRLSAREEAVFRAAGCGGYLTGDFPYEYRAFKVWPAAGPAADGDPGLADRLPLVEADDGAADR